MTGTVATYALWVLIALLVIYFVWVWVEAGRNDE